MNNMSSLKMKHLIEQECQTQEWFDYLAKKFVELNVLMAYEVLCND